MVGAHGGGHGGEAGGNAHHHGTGGEAEVREEVAVRRPPPPSPTARSVSVSVSSASADRCPGELRFRPDRLVRPRRQLRLHLHRRRRCLEVLPFPNAVHGDSYSGAVSRCFPFPMLFTGIAATHKSTRLFQTLPTIVNAAGG